MFPDSDEYAPIHIDPPIPPRPRRLPTKLAFKRPPRWVKWAVLAAFIMLIFRKAIAALFLAVLTSMLHLVGLNIHLPHLRDIWPWSSPPSLPTTTRTVTLGPWILQRIEGISRPAFGQVNFNFTFTRKVSKSIGPWPCWYQSTFAATAQASAMVNLNPGPAWWKDPGHYQLIIVRRPSGPKPGGVTVTMALPLPQLPNSAHQVSVDNLASHPIDVQHSWTYPGLGCGLLLRPQFAQSILYAQAQQIAYWKATNSRWVTGALVHAAENQAVTTIRNNFIQPTVNAFGYDLIRFTIHWIVN